MQFFLEEKSPKLPKININNSDENTYLKTKSFEGLEKDLKKNLLIEMNIKFIKIDLILN